MRRAIFITSGKGGVGKTKVSRFLGEMHRTQRTDALLIDADSAVGTFARYLGARDAEGNLLNPQPVEGGVMTIDWHNDVRSRDEIANLLAHKRDVVIDMPGGSLDGLRALDKDAGYFDVVSQSGFEATFVSLITPWNETWQDAKKIRAWFPSADHILVVNGDMGDAEDFAHWEESKTRTDLLASGSREISLPLLRSGIAAEMAWHRVKFFEAPTSEKLSVLDRGRAKKWLDAATAAIEQVADLLALKTKVAA
jgi:hypothetical protein